MRKIIIISLLLNVLVVPSLHAENQAGKKLYRGVANVLTSPIEIPKQARSYWIEGAQKTDHILVWIGTGSMWGVVQTIKRAGSGLWDIVSFPFNTPDEYEPLMQPAFVFDEWPRNPVSGR